MIRSAHHRSRPLTGLGGMTVLGMRTSWRGPALVAVICIALVVAIAVGVEGLYPNLDQRVEYAATAGASGISNAFNGRGYALTSLGGITGIEVGFMGQLLFPILGVVTAIGMTRRQEEAGRTELLTASRVGRLAPLAAAALLLVLTCAVTAVGLAVSMAATGLPVVGSAWYAAGVGACVLFFAAVGLLLGELCQQARTAQQLGLGAVSVVYLTRFVIDAMGWEAAGPVAVLPASELSVVTVAAGAVASASKRLRHRGPTEAGSERQASRISSTIHSLAPKPATPLSLDTAGPLSWCCVGVRTNVPWGRPVGAPRSAPSYGHGPPPGTETRDQRLTRFERVTTAYGEAARSRCSVDMVGVVLRVLSGVQRAYHSPRASSVRVSPEWRASATSRTRSWRGSSSRRRRSRSDSKDQDPVVTPAASRSRSSSPDSRRCSGECAKR